MRTKCRNSDSNTPLAPGNASDLSSGSSCTFPPSLDVDIPSPSQTGLNASANSADAHDAQTQLEDEGCAPVGNEGPESLTGGGAPNVSSQVTLGETNEGSQVVIAIELDGLPGALQDIYRWLLEEFKGGLARSILGKLISLEKAWGPVSKASL